MTHIALEGRVFVLSACQYLTQDDFPADHPIDFDPPHGQVLIRGESVIIDPAGQVLAGPVFDREAILYADIEPQATTKSDQDVDPLGHYARPAEFALRVDPNDKPVVRV